MFRCTLIQHLRVTDNVPDMLADAERAVLQRRTLRVLTIGQVIGSAALGAAVTVGAYVVQDILGQETPWAGMATATVTVGTAAMSQMLSQRMSTRGRRPGLSLGYLLASAGGLLAAFGADRGWLHVFLIGLFFFGNGSAANLLARYAATDLSREDSRASDMSRIVFASTFGAVFGPVLVHPAQHVAVEWFGIAKYAGPFIFSSVFLFTAFISTTILLRPDPLVLIGGVGQPIQSSSRLGGISRTIASIWDHPSARIALSAMVVSQVTMVAVMTMTPVHLKLHGHEAVSPFVVSLHIAGMYAFSPLVGRFSDRRGHHETIRVGAFLLVAATFIAALSGNVEQLLFPSLWLLGVGWNFGLIGGSSLLTESVSVDSRIKVQGAADLLMSFCGGMGGFASGFIRRAVGYHVLSTFALIAAGALLIIVHGQLARKRHSAAPAAG